MTIYALGFNQAAVERDTIAARSETVDGFRALVGSAVPRIPLRAALNKLSMSIRFASFGTAFNDPVNPIMVFRSGTTELVRIYSGPGGSSGTVGVGMKVRYTQDGVTFIEACNYPSAIQTNTVSRTPTTAHFDFSPTGGIMIGSASSTLFTRRFDFSLFGGTIDNVIFPANASRTLTVQSYIFHDEPMHLAHLHPMTPNAAGAVNIGWSGISVATLTDTTTFATPSANDDVFTINTSNPTNTGVFNASIYGFFGGYYKYFATIVAATRPSGAPALTKLAGVVRVGGVNYFGTDKTVPVEDIDLSYQPYFEVFEANPATNLPWVQADYDTLEFGVRART